MALALGDSDRGQVTHHTWHVTCETLHGTPDTHVKCDTLLQFFLPILSVFVFFGIGATIRMHASRDSVSPVCGILSKRF